ncbi:MAG: OmpA family protein [Tannerellaceae bacterium]|nr:OmpA family protein [Tannerellaceae bacterium]
MAEVSVDVKQFQEGCCSFDEPGRMTVAENKLLYYQPEPKFRLDPYDYEFTELEQYTLDNPFLHSMEDHNQRYDILVKDRDKGTSVVIFTVGSHKLDMNFQGNKDVLDAIAKAFKLIEDDPNAVLKHIMITGYASPEGSLAFNTALAQRRAETVKTYIQSILSSPRNELFELHNGREDWDGLREKVENSRMAEKVEILEIIDSYTMEQEIRKTKLKQLNGGAPYKYMLENFYPPLRSAGYVQVFYEIDRTATVATAVTDELGRTTWVDPESPANVNITRINEALKFIKESDFEQALTQLLQAKDDPKAFNFIGVCHMMMKNYDESGQWFRKALENNDPFAQENIDQLNMMRRVEF